MIAVVKPKKPAKPEIGDVLYGEEYLNRVEVPVKKLLKSGLSRNPNRLLVVGNHGGGFGALMNLNVDAGDLEHLVQYECPWSMNHYYWMYPLGIITDDEGKYWSDRPELRPWDCRIIAPEEHDDFDWLDHVDPSNWNKIVDAMLGHGYTNGTLPSDGGGNKTLATIPLDNGDEILVVCWVWYNK